MDLRLDSGTGGLEQRVEALAAGARMQAGGKAGSGAELAGLEARLDPVSLEQVSLQAYRSHIGLHHGGLGHLSILLPVVIKACTFPSSRCTLCGM